MVELQFGYILDTLAVKKLRNKNFEYVFRVPSMHEEVPCQLPVPTTCTTSLSKYPCFKEFNVFISIGV